MDRATVPLEISVDLLAAIHELVLSGVREVQTIVDRLRPSTSSDGATVREGTRALFELFLLRREGDVLEVPSYASANLLPFKTKLAFAVAEGGHPRWRPIFRALRVLVEQGHVVASNEAIGRAIGAVDPLVRSAGLVRVRWWSRFCDQLGLGFHFPGAGLFVCRPSLRLRETAPADSILGQFLAATRDEPPPLLETLASAPSPDAVKAGLCSILRRFEDPRMLGVPLAREALGDVLEFGRGERVIPCAPEGSERPVLRIDVGALPAAVATATSRAVEDLGHALQTLPQQATWLDQWRIIARDYRAAAGAEFKAATGLSLDEFLWVSATLSQLATTGIVPQAIQDRVSTPPSSAAHPVFEERTFLCAAKGARLVAAEAEALFGLACGRFLPAGDVFNYSVVESIARTTSTLELVQRMADVRLANRSLRKFRSLRSHRNLWVLARALSEFAAGLLSIDAPATAASLQERLGKLLLQLRAEADTTDPEWRQAQTRLEDLRCRLGLPPACSEGTPRPSELAAARLQVEALVESPSNSPIEVLELATRIRAIECNESVRALRHLDDATEKTRSFVMRLRRPGASAANDECTSVRVRLRERLHRLLDGPTRESATARGAVA